MEYMEDEGRKGSALVIRASPLLSRYRPEIDRAVRHLEKWKDKNDITSPYGSAFSVFNEYFSWALWSLYAQDNLPVDVFGKTVADSKANMKRRGFPCSRNSTVK
jgi:hypothetical protein